MAIPKELSPVVGLENDRQTRVETRIKPKVIFTKSKTPDLFLPGTVTILMAKKGNSDLMSLQKAVDLGDSKSINQFSKKLAEGFKDRKEMNLDDAAKLIKSIPSYTQFKYAGNVVIDYMNLSGNLPYAIAIFPYAGGNIDINLFEQIDYAKTAGDSIYESLIVIHEPNLTVDEKALMEKVPNYARETTVGFCPAACGVAAAVVVSWVVVAVVVTSVVAAATAKDITTNFDALNNVHLSADKMRTLGPVNSARELVRLRKEILMTP